MRADDLEQFAAADGLLVRLTAEPGHLSEAEKNYLLFQAARALALAADLKGEEAYRLIYPMTPENRTTIQAGAGFAAVIAWERILFTIRRNDLRGLCHPDLN
jgi:hypothetical protein